MPAWVVDLLNRLNSTFVVDGRWQWFVSGLGYTLLISLFSVLLGLVIGILMALMRLSKSKILRAVSGIYIDIIRGTPTMVQLLIIYFVIFANVHIDKWVVGFIAFGINSGAYIAEIVRGGILSVNIGQTEAGRSLGMTHKQTMASIVMPQAMKNIQAVLTAAGLTLDNVVKTTVFLTNIADFAAVNEVYASFFEGTTYPARCAYQVSALPAGGLVEIETICQK